MAQLTDFLPFVVPYAAGVSDPVALQAIRETAIAFCKETFLVQDRQTTHRIVPGDTVVGTFADSFYSGLTVNGTLHYPVATLGDEQYAAVAPSNTRPHRILAVWADEQALLPAPTHILDKYANWPSRQGSAAYYTRLGSEVAVLTPVPETIPTEVKMTLAYVPLGTATEVPDVLFEEYRKGITAGALAELYAMADQPFTNLDDMPMKAMTYRQAVGKARIDISKGRTNAPLRPQPVFFE